MTKKEAKGLLLDFASEVERGLRAIDSKRESKAAMQAAISQVRAKCPCLAARVVSDEDLYVGPGQYAPVYGAELLVRASAFRRWHAVAALSVESTGRDSFSWEQKEAGITQSCTGYQSRTADPQVWGVQSMR